MTNLIELAKQAGFPVHKSLLSGEEWPEIDGIDIEEELTRFAKLVRNATLEEAKQIEWTEIMREGGLVTWGDQADEHADKTLQCKGEFHPDWHEVRDAYFATLVRNQTLEEAAQKLPHIISNWRITGGPPTASGEQHVVNAIRNLKETTP